MSYLRSFTAAGESASATVVVFPPAGAGCLRLHSIASTSPADVDLVGIQLPGREDRLGEPLVNSLSEVVASVSGELRDTARRRPMAFLGISLGATIAYEVASTLEADAAAPGALVVVAARSPEHWELFPSADPPPAELTPLLPPISGDPEFARYVLTTLRADLRLMAGYRAPSAPLTSTWLRSVSGCRDSVVTAAQMSGWRDRSADFRGHRVIDADHHQLSERAVLMGLVSDIAVEAVPCRVVRG
ncbi:thioesterase domain-containing protein [Streptomyces violaceusniger]|uniref:thioesterase II family protein n=1 Tax=Streptomyces violaceusniger TaxID=68280 RepID=UPI00342AC589